MEKEIQFRPINSGLGFHPFSDGLPYAPTAKTPVNAGFQSGSGAYSAGPAVPVKPQRTQQAQRPAATVIPRAEPVRPIAQPISIPSTPNYGVGYLLRRVFAYGLDTLINTGLCLFGLSLSLWKEGVPRDLLLNPAVFMLGVLFLGVLNWALIAAQEVAFGTSLGKRIFGLALEGTTSAIFMRAFFFIPSAVFFGLGLFWSLIEPKRRCWHDSIVNLQPTEVAHL